MNFRMIGQVVGRVLCIEAALMLLPMIAAVIYDESPVPFLITIGITGGIGFLIAIVLFASIRERLEFSECPKAFEGFPIALVTAGLMALAFMGFSGMKIF